MKRLLVLALSLLLLVGCAGQRLEDTGRQTGIDPFVTGGQFTAADAEALRLTADSKQDYHANLDTWSGIAPTANAQSLLATDYAGMRSALSLVPGVNVLEPTGDGSQLTGIAAANPAYDGHLIDGDKHPLTPSGADSWALPAERPNLTLPGAIETGSADPLAEPVASIDGSGNATFKSLAYYLTTVLPASPVDGQYIVTDGAVLQVYAEQGTDIWGFSWCDACALGAGAWVAEWSYTAGARITSTTSSGDGISIVTEEPTNPADNTSWFNATTGLLSFKVPGFTYAFPLLGTPDPVPPTYVGGTVAVGGLTSVIEFSEEVTFSGYAQDLTMTCASSNGGAPFYLLMPSPEVGTPEIVTFSHFDDAIATNPVTVYQGDTCTVSFAGTVGSIIDTDLLDMAALGPSAITNSSEELAPSGSVVWSNDFESASTWDTTSGNLTLDCDGYDADGDYCDQDTTNYKNGSQGFGIRGDSTYYVSKNLGADLTEFVFKGWMKLTAVNLQNFVYFRDSADTYLAKFSFDTAGVSSFRVIFSTGATIIVDIASCDIASVSVGTWYYVELRLKAESGTDDGEVEIGINTTDTIINTHLTTSVDTGAFTTSVPTRILRIPGVKASTSVYWDDVEVALP